MKPINVYAFTRIPDPNCMRVAERQMSARLHALHIKEWEVEGLKNVIRHLMQEMSHAEDLKFYYSFQIPRLGKEFDLLRISEESIVSIELKSEAVTDERIAQQLQQNRYYLSMLGKPMRFYTYISSIDRLVRMSNKGKLVETGWAELAEDLKKQEHLYEDHIEALFRTEDYIISPLFHPDRFLRREYFLTSQQKDIQRKIRKQIADEEQETAGCGFHRIGITGLPGTGKSLLLYDLAIFLSARRQIALIHCGESSEELRQLDLRLKRIDIMQQEACRERIREQKHSAILVDEAHLLSKECLTFIKQYQEAAGIPVILAYDQEDVVSGQEMDKTVIRELESSDGYTSYRLTNRIRSNGELSAFILNLMHPVGGNPRRSYPNIAICYANDEEEAQKLLGVCSREGALCLAENGSTDLAGGALPRECDHLALVMGESYRYDAQHYLRGEGGAQPVRMLYHNLNRARKCITIVVRRNQDLLRVMLATIGDGTFTP